MHKVLENYGECKVVYYAEVNRDYHIGKEIDAVIISGSEYRITKLSDREKFEGVLGFMETCNLPILGICFGHQLVCWALGAKVGSLSRGNFEGFENINVLVIGELFAGFEKQATIPLAENHYDYVLKESLAGAGFQLLADSASCEVEAVKHRTKPFYGVQFHPERISFKGESHSEGHKVIENFYKNAVKR